MNLSELHLGFYVARAQWKDALAELDRLSILTEDGGRRRSQRPHTGENQGTYMDYPAGYVIQYITEGMHPSCGFEE